MEERTGSAEGYRFGFNGKEADDEVYGNENSLDFGARVFDPRIGRWSSVDALADHPLQISISPYAGMWNNPIIYDDPDGNCPQCAVVGAVVKGGSELLGQTIKIGMQNREQGRSFFSDWGNKVDWADVGIATVEGAISYGIPGSGLLVSGVSAAAKTAVDWKGGESGPRVIGISKDWQDVKKDAVSNLVGFGLGALGGTGGGLVDELGEVAVDIMLPVVMAPLSFALDEVVDQLWPAPTPPSSSSQSRPVFSNPDANDVISNSQSSSQSPNYYVQAGAFHSRENARQYAQQFRDRGYSVTIRHQRGGAGSTAGLYYKVRIKANSSSDASEIQRSVGGGSFIVTE